MPLYEFDSHRDLALPVGCQLVGVELVDDAFDLPSFRHPISAAYVLGPERGSLSPEMLEMCAHVVRSPTRFCINVGLAGALVMYDRLPLHRPLRRSARDGRRGDRGADGAGIRPAPLGQEAEKAQRQPEQRVTGMPNDATPPAGLGIDNAIENEIDTGPAHVPDPCQSTSSRRAAGALPSRPT